MEQATAKDTKRSVKPEQQTPVAKRVEELRSRAKIKKEADVVRDETWAWFKELGGRRDEEALNEVFALGKAPKGLDGQTDGILVVSLIQGVLDRGMGLDRKSVV